jgi:hypothetical protein
VEFASRSASWRRRQRLYRIDKRRKFDRPAPSAPGYDPNRSAFIALVK